MDQLLLFAILAAFMVACVTIVLVPLYALLKGRFTIRSWLLLTAAICVALPIAIVYRQTKQQVENSSPRRATLIAPAGVRK